MPSKETGFSAPVTLRYEIGFIIFDPLNTRRLCAAKQFAVE
jgi:hypothetical protein